MRPAAGRDLVQKVRHRLDELELWEFLRASAGAIFFSPSSLSAFRVPPAVPAAVTVGSRFRVRPLLDALATEEPLYVLSLGAKHVGLSRVAEQKVEPVEVPNLPREMESTLNYDQAERGAQIHIGGPRITRQAVGRVLWARRSAGNSQTRLGSVSPTRQPQRG